MPDYTGIRVCVGIPQPEYTNVHFQNCLWELLAHSTRVGIQVGKVQAVGSVISRNRNMLVEKAKEFQATHLLQIDADSIFAPSALEPLLAHDKPIVCATTSRRAGIDRSPVAEPMDRNALQPYQKLVPMRLVGFPFHLTKMEVFEKLRKPYFADPPRWMMDPTKPDSDEIMQEDEYWCETTRKAGYESLCDMELSMQIGHLGSHTYYIK